MFVRVEYNKVRHFVQIGDDVNGLTFKWFVKKGKGANMTFASVIFSFYSI